MSNGSDTEPVDTINETSNASLRSIDVGEQLLTGHTQSVSQQSPRSLCEDDV